MARSASSSNVDDVDHALLLQSFISDNIDDPEKELLISEIQVLQSIYGDEAVRLYTLPPPNGSASQRRSDGTTRYEVDLSLPAPHEGVSIKILVSLPPTYPKSSPPQLQLLSRYIGAFGADSALFGAILRTYISVSGIEWSEDTVCVFDGLQNVLDRCTAWYEDRLNAEAIETLRRDDVKEDSNNSKGKARSNETQDFDEIHDSTEHEPPPLALPTHIELHAAEPIVDRKSVFVGRACQIHDPSEVPIILSYLMSDRRIARAAHPIINAWRCEVDSSIHQDNDDDGETAAGGRLAHLLQILDVKNVLVVVTRYFGGTHLGPDRFKHINQAARNALEIGGFLDAPEAKKNVGRGKKH